MGIAKSIAGVAMATALMLQLVGVAFTRPDQLYFPATAENLLPLLPLPFSCRKIQMIGSSKCYPYHPSCPFSSCSPCPPVCCLPGPPPGSPSVFPPLLPATTADYLEGRVLEGASKILFARPLPFLMNMCLLCFTL